MDNEPTKITREQLYKEIWEIAVTGVSKKYNVPYSRLMKLCKDNDIPTPPSGYWTSLSFGKQVIQIPLPESAIVEVSLSGDIKTTKNKKPEAKLDEPIEDVVKDDDHDHDHEADQHTQGAHGTYNVYKREVLYKEVWEKPVVQVAQKYDVSDVTIHKVCKSMNIPVPPRGYWARISAGEKAHKTPLPPTKGVTEKIGKKGVKVGRATLQIPQDLSFLSEEERDRVLDAAANIKIREGNERLHKKIVAYKLVVNEWNKNDRKPEGSKRDYKYHSKQPPFLAGVVSNESLPRVYRILDALYCEIEKLGGFINDDLSLLIRNEHVTVYIEEAQDEIKHVITKQEARALIEYKDAKCHGGWASEPKIRKYDHVFNGKLRIYIRDGSRFQDTDTDKVESRLGEMLIALYEESEVVRQKREAREGAERKRAEEELRREEKRERYNMEVEETTKLKNKAADFQIACSIRSYIDAVKENAHKLGIDEAMSDWIEWAQKKADWYDPVIARDDEFFGIRAHEKNAEEKTLNNRRYWY